MKRTAKFVNGEMIWSPPFTAQEEARAVERFDAMVATGQGPALMTDAVFLAGQSTNGSQFEGQEFIGDYYKGIAKKAGVETQGKTYLSGLAERPGDPRAWVNGRGDVQRVLEDRGWGADGAVNVKARTDLAPPKSIGIAEDLVSEYTAKRIAADPGAAERPLAEVREEVRSELKPHWAKD